MTTAERPSRPSSPPRGSASRALETQLADARDALTTRRPPPCASTSPCSAPMPPRHGRPAHALHLLGRQARRPAQGPLLVAVPGPRAPHAKIADGTPVHEACHTVPLWLLDTMRLAGNDGDARRRRAVRSSVHPPRGRDRHHGDRAVVEVAALPMTGRLILTTDLERSLAAKLAVAKRYGDDRDREIVALQRAARAAPPRLTAGDDDERADLRSALDRVCARLLPFHGSPVGRAQAASVTERLVVELGARDATIRALRSDLERMRDGTPRPDPDPIAYTVRESDFDEPLDTLLALMRDAYRQRHPDT
jgi:hypothetical protein